MEPSDEGVEESRAAPCVGPDTDARVGSGVRLTATQSDSSPDVEPSEEGVEESRVGPGDGPDLDARAGSGVTYNLMRKLLFLFYFLTYNRMRKVFFYFLFFNI